MNELGTKQSRHLDFLLADFESIKAEIARRSSLQRTVLVAHVAVVAVIFQWAVGDQSDISWAKILGMWLSAVLASQFYAREHMEIMRLGMIIRDRIAVDAGKLIGVVPESLLPSETNPEQPQTQAIRAAYNRQFNWAVFFVIPLLVTVLFISERLDRLPGLFEYNSVDWWAAFLTLTAAWRTFDLVRKGT